MSQLDRSDVGPQARHAPADAGVNRHFLGSDQKHDVGLYPHDGATVIGEDERRGLAALDDDTHSVSGVGLCPGHSTRQKHKRHAKTDGEQYHQESIAHDGSLPYRTAGVQTAPSSQGRKQRSPEFLVA